MKNVLIILFLVFSNIVIAQNTYYISPMGNDATGDGSFGNPWWSMMTAWSHLSAGDTLYLRGGKYSYTDQQWLKNINGASGNLIQVLAYPGEIPIVSRGTTYTISAYNCGVYFAGDYFHFKGIDFSGYYQVNNDVWSGLRVADSNHNIFENLSIHDNGQGLRLHGNCDDNLVLNCDFYNNYDPVSTIPYDNGDGCEIAFNTNTSSVNTLRGCRSWYNADDGFDGWLDEGKLIIDNCWSWMNGYKEDHSTEGGDGTGFKLGKTDTVNLTIVLRIVKNSLAFDNRSAGILGNSIYCNAEIYNNMVYGNGHSGGWEDGIEFSLANEANTKFYIKNNISINNVTGNYDLQDVTNVDHNSWDGSVTATDIDFVSVDTAGVSGARQSDGGLPVLTLFILKTGSDLIGAGIYVGLTIDGHNNAWKNPPSLGAYEYYSSSSSASGWIKHNGKWVKLKGYWIKY